MSNFTTNGKAGYPLPIITYEETFIDYSVKVTLENSTTTSFKRFTKMVRAEVLTVNINSGTIRVRIFKEDLPDCNIGNQGRDAQDIPASFFFNQFNIVKD
jgi:hypothetical protein